MRSARLSLGAFLLAAAAQAQPRPFSADFPSGGKLRLHVRSGEVRIVGTNENKISVEVSGKRASEATDFRVRLKERDGATEARITGGPKKDVTITVRIPRNTDLYARIPFGEAHVENVVGNKDIELHAGDLTVEVGDSADYSHVDASVYSGELDGHPFGEERGGLFRSFKKEGAGRYRLHAHVGAGQLTLE
jgi:hypothetical protein